MQYKDFDFKDKQIAINKSVYYKSDKPFIKQPKTDAGIRKIPLLEQLEKVMPKMKSDDYIFNYQGEILHNKRFSTLWKNYCKSIGIDITPHQLRHAYATRLYELGIDEKSAQEIMGHADIATMKNIYTHISDVKRKATVEQLKGF